MQTLTKEKILFSAKRNMKIGPSQNHENIKEYVCSLLVYDIIYNKYEFKFHRKNGPAFYYAPNDYYFNYKGFYHRIDGPASVSLYGNTWYFKGKVSYEEFYWNK